MNGILIPLRKVNAAQRTVEASIDETPDRSREVFDYATSKPYFEQWSSDMHKASGGKSYGNVRAMHGMTAAGRVDQIVYDDMGKSVSFVIHVVDDAEWAKVEAGVYTGISPGGRFMKKWNDLADPSLKRYTAGPSEISLVDMPCIPSAVFSMVKADGSTEMRKFAPRANLSQVWATGDGKTFEQKADAERYQELVDANPKALEAAPARDALAKAIASGTLADVETCLAKAVADHKAADKLAPHIEKLAELPADVLAKGDKIAIGKALGLDKAEDLPVLEAAMAKAARDGIKGKPAAENPEKVALIGETAGALAKAMGSAAPADLAKAIASGDLKKAIWNVTDFASAVMTISYAASSAAYEAAEEGDNSPIPGRLKKLAVDAAGIFADWAKEESDEAVAGYLDSGDVVVVVMELAAKLGDMAKASGKLSGANKDRMQAIHDHTASMGADCSGMGKATQTEEMKKAAALAPIVTEILTLAKANGAKSDDDLVVWVKGVVDELGKSKARVTELEALPAPAKGAITGINVTKEQDGANSLSKVAGDETIDDMAKRLAAMPEELRAAEMIKLAHKAGGMKTVPAR